MKAEDYLLTKSIVLPINVEVTLIRMEDAVEALRLCRKEQGEQKPAEWSSRDDSYFEELTEASGLNELQIKWLTEIKDRVQLKQEWSKEDEKLTNRIEGWLDTLCDYLKDDNSPECIEDVKDILEQLKSLKDRVLPQPRQEWSNEEKNRISRIIAIIRNSMSGTPDDISWLKSLRPQSQWKPSDEQMEYLAKAITTLGNEGDCKTASILNELRTNLKKLKG